MLKEYVTKCLPFFQSAGKHEKKPGRNENTEQIQNEDMAAASEDPALETGDMAELFEDPVIAGDPAASWPLEGEGVQPEEEPAEEPPEAIYAAGMAAYEAKNYPIAFERFTRAAERGHPRAQFLCGRMAQLGFAADSGDKPALAWYKRAAKQGDAEAQVACAEMYEQGQGTAMNLKQALFWYEQAAKQGDLKAQVKCGYMYFCGRAETRSPRKARRWLEAAAGNGSAEARKLLEERF